MVNQALYENLKDVARQRQLISYSVAGSIVGLDMKKPPDRVTIARFLKEICEYEVDLNRPMLSAIVVRKDSKRPGPGFYKLARALGKLLDEEPSHDQDFLKSEQEQVYKSWRSSALN